MSAGLGCVVGVVVVVLAESNCEFHNSGGGRGVLAAVAAPRVERALSHA